MRCPNGHEQVRVLSETRPTTKCVQCRTSTRQLWKSTPGLAWNNMMGHGDDRGKSVASEWHNFHAFLADYLEMSGTSLEDHLSKRVQWTYFHISRKNKNLPWSKANCYVTKFVTERAWHRGTYSYWKELLNKELLSDEVLDYKDFTNAFGLKQSGYRLRRKDKTILHSIDNSEWISVRKMQSNTT